MIGKIVLQSRLNNLPARKNIRDSIRFLTIAYERLENKNKPILAIW